MRFRDVSMPYSGASDPDIPSNVPKNKKAQWVKIWNSTYKDCISGGKSLSLTLALTLAQTLSLTLALTLAPTLSLTLALTLSQTLAPTLSLTLAQTRLSNTTARA